jgi:hypothetical protein
MNSLGREIFLFQLLLALALGLLIIVFAKKARADVNLVFTTFAQTNRVSMGFTSAPFSLVRGRFCGTAANVSVRQVVSFAPTGASGRPNEAFAAISMCA